MADTLKDRLRAFLEGTHEVAVKTNDNVADDQEPIGEDCVTEDMKAEATIASIVEMAQNYALELAAEFIKENAHILVRDGLLTENVAGQSFVVLSRESQRSKAERLLRMQMAKKAGDPRYFKIAALRRRIKQLTKEIHNDSRYSEARSIVMKRELRKMPNAAQLSAKGTFGSRKLV